MEWNTQNRYNKEHWRSLTVAELKAFVGLVLVASVISSENVVRRINDNIMVALGCQ